MEEENNMENIKGNSAKKMKSTNIEEESPESKRENIDTKTNPVSNRENVSTEKIPLGNAENIERENNPSNIATGDKFLNNMRPSNTKEDVDGILILISKQRENIATMLQIIEKTIEIFEPTTKYFKSGRERISSENVELSEFISRGFQKIGAFLDTTKYHMLFRSEKLSYLDENIQYRVTSLSPTDILTKNMMLDLHNFELNIQNAFDVIGHIAEFFRLILTDDPRYAGFFFRLTYSLN